MKFTTRTHTEQQERTIDGITMSIPVSVTQRVPVMPRDWDSVATKVAIGLVGMLTMIAVVWSTVSIGSLLGGGVGFLAAILFDISWAICLLLEWKARFDSSKRAFPRNMGWVLLVVTMFFIGWHGVIIDNIPLAVVGASVSLFAKVLWLGVMKYIDMPMSEEDRAWAEAYISQSHARLSIAQIQRQVAIEESKAVAVKLALEDERVRIVGIEQIVDDSNEIANGSNGSVLTGPNAGSNGSNAIPSRNERIRIAIASGLHEIDAIYSSILRDEPNAPEASTKTAIRKQLTKMNGSAITS